MLCHTCSLFDTASLQVGIARVVLVCVGIVRALAGVSSQVDGRCVGGGCLLRPVSLAEALSSIFSGTGCYRFDALAVILVCVDMLH